MKLPKQAGYWLRENLHQRSVISALIWFIKKKNKHCRSFCPLCKWYFRCQEDVEMENFLNNKGE